MAALTRTKSLMRPVAKVLAQESASRTNALEVLAHRFEPARRAAVRRLLYSSSRTADLATVFPGAVYAIAARHGSATRRRKALELVERGAQLKEVADALDLPLWLRRLPPEAFSGPISGLPHTEYFSRRIANHLPRASDDSAFWLESVTFAVKAASERFALWLAQQPVFAEQGAPERLFGVLAAYAWYSSASPTRAKSLVSIHFRPEIALDTAVCAAKSWLNRLRLVVQLKAGVVSDPWLEPGDANGYVFVPLVEERELLAEAQAMQNCADQYAERIVRDRCRLFSVRRRGTRVATIEIGPHPREAGVLAINQLKARHNMPASSEIWQAAHAWLGTQMGLKRQPVLTAPEWPIAADQWQSLLAPYRAEKRGAPWLPEVPSRDAFALLDRDMADLARRAGITSWLFT